VTHCLGNFLSSHDLQILYKKKLSHKNAIEFLFICASGVFV
jgi:hypothetical protein